MHENYRKTQDGDLNITKRSAIKFHTFMCRQADRFYFSYSILDLLLCLGLLWIVQIQFYKPKS